MSGSPLYASKKGTPRPAETYRAARRNAARGTVWAGVAHSAARLPSRAAEPLAALRCR
jgi:hypothetical protein